MVVCLLRSHLHFSLGHKKKCINFFYHSFPFYTFLLLIYLLHTQINKKKTKAHANEIGDIEFTVCELNCSNNQNDEQNSPVHERKPRFSSLRSKKGGAISKAVRNKLNLSKSSTQSAEKQNSCGGESTSSFDHEHRHESISTENGNAAKIDSAQESLSAGSNKASHPTKVTKKKSKLCLLL